MPTYGETAASAPVAVEQPSAQQVVPERPGHEVTGFPLHRPPSPTETPARERPLGSARDGTAWCPRMALAATG
jgi:hypothetical protein